MARKSASPLVATAFSASTLLGVLLCLLISGCTAGRATAIRHRAVTARNEDGQPAESSPEIMLTALQAAADDPDSPVVGKLVPEEISTAAANHSAEPNVSLSDLEVMAQTANPDLRRLEQEAAAARAKARYVDKLPDPTVGANIFAHPIETAAGSQRANLQVMQMIPWLERLDAQSQQACFDAIVMQQLYLAERLKTVGDVRASWYRLYVIGKQIETTRANQDLLKSLIEIANASVATGRASQGDVLLGTLEYSRLEEQILTWQQQQKSTEAELKRLTGQDVSSHHDVPQAIDVALPDWSYSGLKQVALENQPAIAAAQLRTRATRWGIEVARLKRRPDLSVNASWFGIDDNRPATGVVDVGRDAWSIGAQVSIPLWTEKYDAMEQEARWKHSASHASVNATVQRFEAVLRDLWEQAQTSHETAQLYEATILPQAKQTLEADQQAYANGTVEFDRVIGDFRNVLTLELGYHRAMGSLATALARIRQAVGKELL